MPKDQIKDLVNEFDNRVKFHEMDASFKQLEVPPFDLKDTLKQKKEAGIANFWQRAIINHPNISKHISEKDRVILQALVDIRCTLHEDHGFGFDLTFVFEKSNPYFLEEEIVKKFIMSRQNVIDKMESTKINWKDCQNPTRKKVKKKRKGKKIAVEVACDSFFTFFDQVRMPTDEDLKKGNLTIVREDLEAHQPGDEDILDENNEQIKTKRTEPSKESQESPSEQEKQMQEEDVGERMDRDY